MRPATLAGLGLRANLNTMTRTEAIAAISAKLATLDDERVLTVADIVQSLDETSAPLRQLSVREQALLAQSKADFAAGRSYSLQEVKAMLDDELESLGVPRSTT